MSFSLRRYRYSIGRVRAGADSSDVATPDISDVSTDRPTQPAAARLARLTDAELRAAASNAIGTDSFCDGLPIPMSLD